MRAKLHLRSRKYNVFSCCFLLWSKSSMQGCPKLQESALWQGNKFKPKPKLHSEGVCLL